MTIPEGMNLSLSGRIRWRLAQLLWPAPPVVPEIAWTYTNDGLMTLHNCDFLADPLFSEAYRLGKATGSWGDAEIAWRVHVLCWAAARGAKLEGDFVECGVNKGGFSRAVMHYIGFEKLLGRKFYLLDTYRGVPDEMLTEATRSLLSNRYEDCYDEVVRTFASFENAVIIRGTIPATLEKVRAEKVCYLSIDMNSAPPEIAAAEYFWDRLSSGAAVVLDDYGFSPFIEQKLAFDDFARRREVQILSLPTGQGLILKP